MDNNLDNKKTTTKSGNKFVSILFCISVFLILTGVILSFTLKDNYSFVDGEGEVNDSVEEEIVEYETFSHGGVTLKRVSDYTYSLFNEDFIQIKNDKYQFVVTGIVNTVITDESFKDIASNSVGNDSKIIDSGSRLLSNGKDLKYVISSSSIHETMIYYYNVLDSYTLIGSVSTDDYEGVYDEFVRVFDGIEIDSSMIDADVDDAY